MSGGCFRDRNGSLRGGATRSFRPAHVIIRLLSILSGEVFAYIIVVDPKISSPNPHAAKNNLESCTEGFVSDLTDD